MSRCRFAQHHERRAASAGRRRALPAFTPCFKISRYAPSEGALRLFTSCECAYAAFDGP